MALGPALKSLFKGDLTDAANFLLTPQSVIDESDDVQSRWDKFLSNQVAVGKLSNEDAARTLQNLNRTDVSSGAIFTDPATSPWEGFKEGWDEGMKAETSLISNTLNGVGGFVWKAIPLWVWLGGGVALFIWLGGLDLVRAAIRRKAAA